MPVDTFGLYLHIPFCIRRCAYCDFFSSEGKRNQLPPYVRALIREIAMTGAAGERPSAGTVFFGGGTPSLLAPEQAERLLGEIRRSFQLAPEAEITLEANPGTLDRGRLEGFRKAGINRLSLGVQSAEDSELALLGRIHSFADAQRTCLDARRAGWANINLDLIYGLPGRSVESWGQTLDRALALSPEHLSLYALTLERGTKLARAVRRGALPAPDEDAAADMYELAEEKLAAAGYRHYEISNWARDGAAGADTGWEGSHDIAESDFPAYACKHNLRYWLNLSYLGFGAGAHGCAAGRRYANIRSIEKYIERMQAGRARRFPLTPAGASSALRTREEEMRETMWLGLRLTEAGVDRENYRRRFEEDYYVLFRVEIDSALKDGLLEWADEEKFIRLTKQGRLLGNRVFRLFVTG
jgi:oxygen-independent coproporphyrinogen-3 oxidase